jgi:hypothetical protein
VAQDQARRALHRKPFHAGGVLRAGIKPGVRALPFGMQGDPEFVVAPMRIRSST